MFYLSFTRTGYTGTIFIILVTRVTFESEITSNEEAYSESLLVREGKMVILCIKEMMVSEVFSQSFGAIFNIDYSFIALEKVLFVLSSALIHSFKGSFAEVVGVS